MGEYIVCWLVELQAVEEKKVNIRVYFIVWVVALFAMTSFSSRGDKPRDQPFSSSAACRPDASQLATYNTYEC